MDRNVNDPLLFTYYCIEIASVFTLVYFWILCHCMHFRVSVNENDRKREFFQGEYTERKHTG